MQLIFETSKPLKINAAGLFQMSSFSHKPPSREVGLWRNLAVQ
jgi:hypothetical protein